MNPIIITSAIVTAVGGALYYFYKKGGELYFRIKEDNSETIEGELKLAHIVSYLKLQNLDERKHIPFIANWKDIRVKKIVKGDSKEGYEAIFVGAYNDKSSDIDVYRVFFAKSLDAELKETMGNETLIVLS